MRDTEIADHDFGSVRAIAAEYGWSFKQATRILTDFFAEVSPRSDRLSRADVVALFREHHLKARER